MYSKDAVLSAVAVHVISVAMVISAVLCSFTYSGLFRDIHEAGEGEMNKLSPCVTLCSVHSLSVMVLVCCTHFASTTFLHLSRISCTSQTSENNLLFLIKSECADI